MKRLIILGILGFFFSHPSLAVASGGGVGAINPSPTGLEAYYPPRAEGPVYLFRMLDMEGKFSGIAAELAEGDIEGAKKLYQVFKVDYLSVKGMVAEWKDAYPEGALETLGRALEGADRGTMFKALEGVGAICHKCHGVAMVPAQQKFRWGDFSALTVDDGEGGEAKSYTFFKKLMAANMAGINVDAGQGQWANARKQFVALKGRFAALLNTCGTCHAKEPANFTDPEALGILETELGKPLPDAGRVADSLKAFGRQSCSGCHLIHVPAAMAATASR